MTPKLAPQTVFPDLMQRAHEYVHGSRLPSEFELKRFEKEIECLSQANPAGMLELRACIAAARGDVDSMISYFERALPITRDLRGTPVRYMQALSACGATEKLREVFDRYHGVLRGDPAALRITEGAMACGGWIFTARDVNDELERMGVNKAEDRDIAVVQTHGFDEASIAQPIGFSQRFLRARGVRTQTVHTLQSPFEDGGAAIMIELAVDDAPERVAELEWELFGALEEQAFPAEMHGVVRMVLTSRQGIQDADLPC